MNVNINWLGDLKFSATTTDGLSVLIDSDRNTAPCPTEILLSALGSCSATDVALYFQDKNLPLTKLTNELTYTLTDAEPHLYKSVNLHFTVAGQGITSADIVSAAEIAINKYCHVCLMLQPSITVTFTTAISTD